MLMSRQVNDVLNPEQQLTNERVPVMEILWTQKGERKGSDSIHCCLQH